MTSSFQLHLTYLTVHSLKRIMMASFVWFLSSFVRLRITSKTRIQFFLSKLSFQLSATSQVIFWLLPMNFPIYRFLLFFSTILFYNLIQLVFSLLQASFSLPRFSFLFPYIDEWWSLFPLAAYYFRSFGSWVDSASQHSGQVAVFIENGWDLSYWHPSSALDVRQNSTNSKEPNTSVKASFSWKSF